MEEKSEKKKNCWKNNWFYFLILFVKEFGLFTLQIFQTSFQVYD